MTYKTRKIFDANTPAACNERGLWESICIVNSELHCQYNDSYMPWTIGDKYSGGGYITDDEVKAISDWLISEGGEEGEDVLILVSW